MVSMQIRPPPPIPSLNTASHSHTQSTSLFLCQKSLLPELRAKYGEGMDGRTQLASALSACQNPPGNCGHAQHTPGSRPHSHNFCLISNGFTLAVEEVQAIDSGELGQSICSVVDFGKTPILPKPSFSDLESGKTSLRSLKCSKEVVDVKAVWKWKTLGRYYH